MMLGVYLKPGDNALMTHPNPTASNFFTLCFYTYYFLLQYFYTNDFFNLSKLASRNRGQCGSIAGANHRAIKQRPP
jgi:hypothetical protein